MLVPEAVSIEPAQLAEALESFPNSHGVFVVWAGEQSAYLGKTTMLRRRLARVLPQNEVGRRALNLRRIATRVDYWVTGSRFESTMTHYAVARQQFREDYLKRVKLTMPAYVKLLLGNPFPRTQVTTRAAGGPGLVYGPFRSRSAAELFESQFLDLFQIRRCQENLMPYPDHPGCIYGEMNRCLRPCQQVVSVQEYGSEVARVAEFLSGAGTALLNSIASARDRFSNELDFEEAARQHKRYEQVQSVLALRDDLVADIDRLFGVAVTPCAEPDSVLLWFLCAGVWQTPQRFPLISDVSMDHRLRELVNSLQPETATAAERQEHLALLARWHYSTWSDGEWIGFPGLEHVPYRKLVRAISRAAQGG